MPFNRQNYKRIRFHVEFGHTISFRACPLQDEECEHTLHGRSSFSNSHKRAEYSVRGCLAEKTICGPENNHYCILLFASGVTNPLKGNSYARSGCGYHPVKVGFFPVQLDLRLWNYNLWTDCCLKQQRILGHKRTIQP